MYFKDGKWAKKILDLQHQDGSWGYFHTLSNPTSKQPMTTEQALRRLEILGYTINDKPIQKTIKYLKNCLTGKDTIPDRPEIQTDWEKFKELMISTWIKRFIPDDKRSNALSGKWAEIVTGSFIDDEFSQSNFDLLFYKVLCYDKTKKAIRFMTFYPISLVAGNVSKDVEPLFFKHILNYDKGITYFHYAKPLIILPKHFESKEASAYIMEIELLTGYKNIECKKQLLFVREWIQNNKTNDNEWDMGKESKDGIYFPLSDSWRLNEDRIKDCTYRINQLLSYFT
jgi:hypothetical protein